MPLIHCLFHLPKDDRQWIGGFFCIPVDTPKKLAYSRLMKFIRTLDPVLGKDCVHYTTEDELFRITAQRSGVQLQGTISLHDADDYETFARAVGEAASDHRALMPRILSPEEAQHEH